MSKELINYSDELKAMDTIADYASKTKWFESLGGKAGAALVALYARELGLPVMQCLFGGMKSVLGKIEISPQMMNSLIRQSGHKLQITSTSSSCKIKGIRADTGEPYECSFTVEDAKKAGIYKVGGGWDKYPEDMCFARCISRIARRLFPDVIGPSYVAGELETEKDGEEIKPSLTEIATAEVEVIEDKKISPEQIHEYHQLTKDYPKYQKIMSKKYPSINDLTESQFNSFKIHFDNWKVDQAFKKDQKEEEKVAEVAQEAAVIDEFTMPF